MAFHRRRSIVFAAQTGQRFRVDRLFGTGTGVAFPVTMASMKTWPEREKPRERLAQSGPAALGDAELIALLLGTGSSKENAVEVARRLLGEVHGIVGLFRAGMGALSRIDGIGQAKAARLVAAMEIGFRLAEQAAKKPGREFAFCSSLDIYRAYRARLAVMLQEVVLVVGVNTKNNPISEVTVAKGSVDECLVTPREVFRPMIAEAARRVILVHNHPSGDPTPSPHDVALTNRLCRVGEVIGIPVLDHIIIGHDSFCSLRDMGLLGESAGDS